MTEEENNKPNSTYETVANTSLVSNPNLSIDPNPIPNIGVTSNPSQSSNPYFTTNSSSNVNPTTVDVVQIDINQSSDANLPHSPNLNPTNRKVKILPSYEDAIKEIHVSPLSSPLHSRSPSPIMDLPPAYPGMERPEISPQITYIMSPETSPLRSNPYGVTSRGSPQAGNFENQLGMLMIRNEMLGKNPKQITCPHCQRNILTTVEEELSETAWIACCLLFICGCQLGCCFIPFFLPDFKNYRHYCSHCKRLIGVYRPM